MTLEELYTLDEFKKLPKDERTLYLKITRNSMSDDEIAAAWGLKKDAFQYHLKVLGLVETKLKQASEDLVLEKEMSYDTFKLLDHQGRTNWLRFMLQNNTRPQIQAYLGIENKALHYHLNRLKLAHVVKIGTAPKNTKSNIIELEYSVQAEPKTEVTQLAIIEEVKQPVVKQHMINYPSVTGNVAQLRKRLEAILTLVELDGEDAELVLSITIDLK